ncbi:MAG: hypothetical protein ACE5JJ_12020 [Nitrospinota bacterium]
MSHHPLRALVAVASLLALAAILPGCATGLGKKARKPPPDYRFADLPTPASLKLNSNDSFIFENASVRAGYLVYTGREGYRYVIRFFRENMPQHGWRLVSSFERGVTTLIYEKPGWSSQIIVRPGTLGTRVEIQVGPTAEAPRRPSPGREKTSWR